VEATEKQLETLGKNLKKNNVSLDLVSFGEVEENNAKLTKLLQAVNSNETSHLVEVPVGPKLLSDVLLSSPIITPEGEAPMAGGGGDGGAGFEFGINPAEDPELALALRISMEEERARQQKAEGGDAKPEGEAGAAATGDSTAAPAAAGGPTPQQQQEVQQQLRLRLRLPKLLRTQPFLRQWEVWRWMTWTRSCARLC